MASRFKFNFGGAPTQDFELPQVSFNRPRGGEFDLAQNNQPLIPMKQNTQIPPSTSAYDKFIKTQNEMPIYGSKEFESGKWGKLGALLAGSAVGGLSGDADRGIATTKSFLDNKYNKAAQAWQQRFKVDQAGAVEERQQGELDRKRRLDESTIGVNQAKIDEAAEVKGLNRIERLAKIESTIASTGRDQAATQQIMNDINNPDLMKEADNKGGINFYDKKTGSLVKRHEGVNISAEALKGIDFKHDTALKTQGGNIGANNLKIQLWGFKELEKDRQKNRRELADDKFLKDVRLGAQRTAGQLQVQNDAQEFKKAQTPADLQRRLSAPQYKREVNTELARLETTNPDAKALIQKYFARDANGNYGLADPTDPQGLELMNEVLMTLHKNGVR